MLGNQQKEMPQGFQFGPCPSFAMHLRNLHALDGKVSLQAGLLTDFLIRWAFEDHVVQRLGYTHTSLQANDTTFDFSQTMWFRGPQRGALAFPQVAEKYF